MKEKMFHVKHRVICFTWNIGKAEGFGSRDFIA